MAPLLLTTQYTNQLTEVNIYIEKRELKNYIKPDASLQHLLMTAVIKVRPTFGSWLLSEGLKRGIFFKEESFRVAREKTKTE